MALFVPPLHMPLLSGLARPSQASPPLLPGFASFLLQRWWATTLRPSPSTAHGWDACACRLWALPGWVRHVCSLSGSQNSTCFVAAHARFKACVGVLWLNFARDPPSAGGLFLICAADYPHLLKGGIKWFQVRAHALLCCTKQKQLQYTCQTAPSTSPAPPTAPPNAPPSCSSCTTSVLSGANLVSMGQCLPARGAACNSQQLERVRTCWKPRLPPVPLPPLCPPCPPHRPLTPHTPPSLRRPQRHHLAAACGGGAH